MTPHELMERLERLLQDLSQLNDEYKEKQIAFVQKDNTYKLEKSKQYLINKASMGKATINEIEAKTFIDVQNFKIDADIAEAELKATKERLDAIKIEIDTVRSMLSYLKSEFERTE